jgi:hypothetical protein
VDLNKVIERVKAILLTPKTEWPVIAEEPTSVADLYKNYIVLLAAVPAIFSFLGSAVFGVRVPFGGTVRLGVGFGLTNAIASYVIALATVYIMALIVNALAQNFGGQKNMVQAVKVVAYAYTAAWIATIGQIVPFLSVLILVAGAGYSIYLLYLGLPHTMKCPQDRAATYTVVVIVIAIILSLVLGMVVGRLTMGSFMTAATYDSGSASATFDKDSTLGKLEEYGKKLEEAGKKMEAAEKSGDKDAQASALQQMMGAALGSDGKPALAPDRLKPFIPETLAGMKRASFNVERNEAIGIQVSHARATYEDEAGRSVRLEITDTGTARGLLALADWTGMESQSETDHGYERTYKVDGRLVHEQWDKSSSQGEYAVVLGERFTVKVDGSAESIDQLKALVGELDLSALEALKDEGA